MPTSGAQGGGEGGGGGAAPLPPPRTATGAGGGETRENKAEIRKNKTLLLTLRAI